MTAYKTQFVASAANGVDKLLHVVDEKVRWQSHIPPLPAGKSNVPVTLARFRPDTQVDYVVHASSDMHATHMAYFHKATEQYLSVRGLWCVAAHLLRCCLSTCCAAA